MIPLGQFRDTFIIAIDEEGIAIIDQHVAHERVLFERVMERLTSGPLESQRLLVPHADGAVAGGAPGARSRTRRRSSGSASRSRSSAATACGVAARARRCSIREECEAAVRALAEDLEGLDRGAGVEEALQRIAATMACHAAVKANYPLTMEKMAHILEELRRTAYSTRMPARPAGHAAH